MIEQTATAVPEIEGAATLPDQLDEVLGALSAAAIDGLPEADLLHVITTLEATKAQVPATDASGMGVKTPEQGAATSVLLATWPGLRGVGGRYFEDCHEAEVVDQVRDGLHGVCAYALDPVTAERLWDVSTSLVTNAH